MMFLVFGFEKIRRVQAVNFVINVKVVVKIFSANIGEKVRWIGKVG